MSSRRRFGATVGILAMGFTLLGSPAQAQTGAASITGLIVDETGAALPGVTVTATNQATNVEQVAVTNQAAGNYTITPVVVGTYIVKAELPGSDRPRLLRLALEARQVARLDFKMGVGGIAENRRRHRASPRYCRPRPPPSARSCRGTPSSRCRSTAGTPASSRCCSRAPSPTTRAASPTSAAST